MEIKHYWYLSYCELMITSHFEGENRALKEMRCLASPIHDALKLTEHSII
jgi:hypothetical protein